jgi:hypothetical protein
MTQRAPGGVEPDGQYCIDLLVERAVAGEAPSSPQPPEAGARRARLCVGHVRQFGGESPLCNLMEVKH